MHSSFKKNFFIKSTKKINKLVFVWSCDLKTIFKINLTLFDHCYLEIIFKNKVKQKKLDNK